MSDELNWLKRNKLNMPPPIRGKNKGKLKIALKFLSYFFVFGFISLIIFSSQISTINQNSSSWLNKIPIVKQLKHLVESADKELKGEKTDRINILLLGIGGKNHEGGLLTDTIILASLKPSEKKVSLISIPRDLSMPVENVGWRKINNINAYAEVQNPGSGGMATSQALSDILNIPIDYYARVDFAGFIKIIDKLGGVKIYVENTFDDYSYPVLGMEEAEPYEARFEHLHFDKGWQEMDGSLALKYARSRHASGVEGSDFARAKRQQKILTAFKDKILSSYIIFRPKLISDIINTYQKHVSTNLKVWEMIKLWDIFKDVEGQNITNKVLDNSPNGLLVDIIAQDGAYVLVPRSGDFAEIQYLVNNIFSDAPVKIKEEVTHENASLEIRNGTWINGLGSRAALDLEKFGFKVLRVGNSVERNIQKSTIYDLTYGEKIKSLTLLKKIINANVSFGLPQWLIDELAESFKKEKDLQQPDFILILGQNADSTGSGAVNTVE